MNRVMQVLPKLNSLSGRKRIEPAQQLLPLAPGTRSKMRAVSVLLVLGADCEVAFDLFERILPCRGVGPDAWLGVAFKKTAHEQLTQGRVQGFEWRRRPHRQLGGPRSTGVREMARANALFQGGWLARAEMPAGERVRAFHKQLKEQHRQAETIVLGQPILL
jgi:hypothetical protein